MDGETRPWQVGSVAQILDSSLGQKWPRVLRDCILYLNGYLIDHQVRYQHIVISCRPSFEKFKEQLSDNPAYIFSTTEYDSLTMGEATVGTHHLVVALFELDNNELALHLWHPAFE